MHFRPRFWAFSKFWGFYDFCEIFGLGVDYLMLYDHVLHFFSIITMFHAFRCVLDYWKLCAGRFGLGFNPWCNLFLARHMFMHIFSTSHLSLSLSRIDWAWHLSENLLRLGILLVLGLLLFFLFPLFTFGSEMGRPNRISLRTFRNVAFIRSAMLFRRTFPTLLSLWSFVLGVGNLFVRYPWGVSSCL